MPRNVSNPPVWPRRIMAMTAIVIAIVALLGFNALSKQNFTLAFPLFASVVALLLLEIFLMYLQNRR